MRSSQSWGENGGLASSLEQASELVARLLDCAGTEQERKEVLLLNTVHQVRSPATAPVHYGSHQELVGIRERSSSLLGKLLQWEKGTSSSLLLLARRWAEFCTRFQKTSPEMHKRLQVRFLHVFYTFPNFMHSLVHSLNC